MLTSHCESKGEKMKQQKKLYELNPSQEVVRMQLLFTIDKRVINIITSATSEDKLDWDILEKAVYKSFERNDCLHLKFVKYKRKWHQYFDENAKLDKIERLRFETKQAQDEYIEKLAKKPIKYKKGEVIKIFFVETYDKKCMILLKVCHLILDMYGINILFNDIFGIYSAMQNGTEMPKQPAKFEDVLKKDIERKNNEEIKQKNYNFFYDYYKDKPEPYYAGAHGNQTYYGKKYFKKHLMKMFFVKNNTIAFMKNIDGELGKQMFDYCQKFKVSPANFLFFACSLTQSKLNSDVENQLQLELSNCRATMIERTCAGTKAQSLGCYVSIKKDKTIDENFEVFNANQTLFYRHLGMSDMIYQNLTHKIWNSSPIKTYYALAYSFIPFVKPKGVSIQMYSNGKFALPLYFGAMYDVNTHEIQVAYECQKKLYNESLVDNFHKNLMHIIDQMLNNSKTLVSDVKLLENK